MKQALKYSIYALLYWSGFWLLARWLTRDKTRILMYHGVVQEDIDVWTQLPVVQFRAQMAHLAKCYRPVRLTDFVDNRKGTGTTSRLSAIVTFDDGLKNNLTTAYPVLAELKIPATIYIAISLIDRPTAYGGMIWTDYVRGLIRSSNARKLDLSLFGLSVFELDSDTARRASETSVGRALKGVQSELREKVIAEISHQLGETVTREHAAPFDGLTWDEIRQMDRSGLIEFGAHTVSHAILSKVSDQQAEQEMVGSKTRLERELNHPIRHFAYPNGTRADFSDTHMKLAAKYFESAVSTIEGIVAPSDGLYDLKRINIGNDMSLMEFKLRLSGALDLLGV